MIQFQMFDHQPERCEKYHQMLTDNLPVPEDAHSVISDGENLYIIGRNRIYCRECDRKGEM